ncbi:MAG: YceI family protein [Sandaracinaceae bacterium]|nr:YceI family protein [Sandaracinaceae bacterium]
MVIIAFPDAEIRVYTLKEGLFSALGHDLEILVERFEIKLEGATLSVSIDPKSLRVLHALSSGRPIPSALSERDKRSIEETIAREVLQVDRYPRILYRATLRWEGGLPFLDGTLELCGVTRKVAFSARKASEWYVARVRLHQPDFGIRPYSALFGALRIQPDVEVEAKVLVERIAQG